MWKCRRRHHHHTNCFSHLRCCYPCWDYSRRGTYIILRFDGIVSCDISVNPNSLPRHAHDNTHDRWFRTGRERLLPSAALAGGMLLLAVRRRRQQSAAAVTSPRAAAAKDTRRSSSSSSDGGGGASPRVDLSETAVARLRFEVQQWWDCLPAPSVHNTADDDEDSGGGAGGGGGGN